MSVSNVAARNGDRIDRAAVINASMSANEYR